MTHLSMVDQGERPKILASLFCALAVSRGDSGGGTELSETSASDRRDECKLEKDVGANNFGEDTPTLPAPRASSFGRVLGYEAYILQHNRACIPYCQIEPILKSKQQRERKTSRAHLIYPINQSERRNCKL